MNPVLAAVEAAVTSGVARVVAAFAPMIALSSVLSQTISGFQVFTAAIKVFSASVAPLLLPVFAVLAAAVLTASDILWAKLLPSLGEFYQFVISAMLPGVGAFLDIIEAATDAVKAFVEWVEWFRDAPGKAGKALDFTDEIGGSKDGPSLWEHLIGWVNGKGVGPGPGGPAGKRGAALGTTEDDAKASEDKLRDLWKNGDAATKADIARMVPDMVGLWEKGQRKHGADDKRSWKDRMTEVAAGMGGKGAAGGAGNAGLFGQALQDVLGSLRQSIGPPQSMGDAGGLNRRAQQAVLGDDPLERRTRQRNQEALDKLIEAFRPMLGAIATNTAKRPKGLQEGED